MGMTNNSNNIFAAVGVFVYTLCVLLIYFGLIVIAQAIYIVAHCVGLGLSMKVHLQLAHKSGYLPYYWGRAGRKLKELDLEISERKLDFEQARFLFQTEHKKNEELVFDIEKRRAHSASTRGDLPAVSRRT